MNEQRTVDDRISRWLIEEADGQLSRRVLDAAYARTRVIHQRPTRRWTSSPRRSGTVLLAATLMLAGAVVGGGLLLAGRPTRTEEAPTTTALPSPIASPSPEALSFETFESPMYGYRVDYPRDWTVSAASAPGQSDLFMSADGQRFAVSAESVTAGQSDLEWVEANIPPRTEIAAPGCSGPWLDSVIDGLPALVRTGCWYVDGVVRVGGSAYRLASTGGPGRWLFDRFAATIVFDRVSPSPTPVPSSIVTSELPSEAVAFVSLHHGYSVSFPSDWRVVPAANDTRSDVFEAHSSDTRLSIKRLPKPASTPLDVFAEETRPHRASKTGCHWNSSGIIFIPAGQRPFERTEVVPEHEAVVRAECGFVDAVVDLEDEVLLIVVQSGERRPDGDLATFEKFAKRLEIAQPSLTTTTSAGHRTFISPLYGFSIDYPGAWVTTPAKLDGYADQFVDTRGTLLAISMVDRPAGMTAVEWANRSVPDRAATTTTHRHCDFRNRWIEAPPPANFGRARIKDREAAIRSMCGVVDAVIRVHDRFLVIVLRTSRKEATGDDALFQQLVATLEPPRD
jgi:hypothetical protein